MRRGIGVPQIAAALALAAVVVVTLALVAVGANGDGQEDAVRAAIAQAQASAGNEDGTVEKSADPKKFRKLTPEEERIIVHKGTERPFTGEYDNHFAEGIYTCRRCGAMLYRSDDKFRSECGWPSFDDEIVGAVKRVPDADGRRTEIVCANCDAHLGHVFTGERLTDKNTRHCVNSLSMLFTPADEVKFGRAYFAAGCFWGVEYNFQMQPGVLDTTVGYIGGTAEKPTYESVCSHTTGHAEAVEVLFDPVRVSFEELAKLFFEIHDATQVNRQGPDVGDQYRSEIFYTDKEHAAVAEALIKELEGRGMKIATRVTRAAKFWPAEDYHQDWFIKKGSDAACHARRKLW